MTAGQTGTVIIGIGNEYRRDDGVGIVVARRLSARVPAGVTVMEKSDEGASLLEAWKGAASAILVDAVASGAAPGTIHRFDAVVCSIPQGFFRYSTHAFSVAEAVELARSLNQLPARLMVYGIEGQDFSSGIGLSAAVEGAVASAVRQVIDELSPTSADIG
ncbi:MAG: hydrogenase maturation protease [Acidobacteriota bacterium]|nr:hydrogenase maturation protease [Acidobacteriota bacterium]